MSSKRFLGQSKTLAHVIRAEGLLPACKLVFSKIAGKPFIHKVPAIVHIELNNTCNFKCHMCPIGKMKRKREFMDFATYKKIVDECAKLHIHHIKLFLLGEPLLHLKLVDFIKYAKAAGIPIVSFDSNASLLSKIDQKALIKSGIDEIVFSVTGATQDTYKRFQNEDLAPIEANIKSFIGLKRKIGAKKPRVTMQFISSEDSKHEVANYIQKWSPYVDNVNISKLSDYYDPNKKSDLETRFCHYLGSTLVVLSNGAIVPCCQDYEGSLSLGNIRNCSLSDAWGSKKLNGYRKLHLAGKGNQLCACKDCSEMYKGA